MSKKIRTEGGTDEVWSNDRNHKAIIKSLERITAWGHRPDQIFEDWLSITEATLRMLPAHAERAATHGTMAEDDDETKKLWAEINKRYPAKAWPYFQEAFRILLDSTSGGGYVEYYDLIGNLYMDWGNPNKHNGQFFTPWPIAEMMARMTLTSEWGPEEVFRRLRIAISKSPVAEAFMMAASVVGTALESDAALEMLATRVLPLCIEHYEPIGVQDPAVGSGVMLLAAASIYPEWMVRLGLVRFYGQDIDHTCVKMARINMMLYGLNGYGIKLAMGGYLLQDVYRRRFGQNIESQIMPASAESTKSLDVELDDTPTMNVQNPVEPETPVQRDEPIIITASQVDEQLGLFGGAAESSKRRRRKR